MALFTLEELASVLQQDLDTATATKAATRAENYLRAELGVEFTSASRTHTARIPRTRTYLALPGPVTSVTSVTVDGSPLVVTVDYEATDAGVSCPHGFGQDATTAGDWCSAVVVYVGGFATVPAELVDWGLYLAGLAYDGGPQPGLRSSTITVEGVSEAKTFTDGAAAFGLDPGVLKSLRARYGSKPRTFGSVLLR